jgi:hypothetical protein
MGKGKSIAVGMFVALVGCGGFLSLSDDEDEAQKSPPAAGGADVAVPAEGTDSGEVVDHNSDGGDGGDAVGQFDAANEPKKTFWACGFDAREYTDTQAMCESTLAMRGCWAIGVPRDQECLPEDASAGTQRLYCEPCSMVVGNRYTFSAWWCRCQ